MGCIQPPNYKLSSVQWPKALLHGCTRLINRILDTGHHLQPGEFLRASIPCWKRQIQWGEFWKHPDNASPLSSLEGGSGGFKKKVIKQTKDRYMRREAEDVRKAGAAAAVSTLLGNSPLSFGSGPLVYSVGKAHFRIHCSPAQHRKLYF